MGEFGHFTLGVERERRRWWRRRRRPSRAAPGEASLSLWVEEDGSRDAAAQEVGNRLAARDAAVGGDVRESRQARLAAGLGDHADEGERAAPHHAAPPPAGRPPSSITSNCEQ